MSANVRRALVVLLSGLLLGGVLGLFLGWVAFPVRLVDVIPADLEPEYQADYLDLIAATYVTDGNLAMARNRISSLGQDDWRAWLLAETVNAILREPAAPDTARLVALAAALGLESPAFDPYLETEQAGS